MATLTLGGKTVLTQTGSDEPVLSSNLTGTLGSGITFGSNLTGTLGSGITFPAGHVVQVVPFTSTTGTDVQSTSETPISSSKKAITLKTNNPLIIYNAILGYESDTSGSTNFFFDLRYSSDDTTYTAIDSTTRINGTHVDNSLGTGSTTIVTQHAMSGLYNAGDTVYYQLYFSKSNASSIYFNQPALAGQPSGTSNMSSGCIMEIMQ